MDFYDIPFVPSSNERLADMLDLANVKPGQKTVDLGSGDGRVVIAMAKLGAQAQGIEIDPDRARLSQENALAEKLDGQVTIYNQSFWEIDLSEFEIITLYGITSMMERLEAKILEEAKPGTKVISNYFTFPTWEHTAQKGDVYLYIR